MTDVPTLDRRDQSLDVEPVVDDLDVGVDNAGVSADLVRVYLNEIGRTPLLTAEQEVDLAIRIETGVYAEELLRRDATGEEPLTGDRRAGLQAVAADGRTARTHMLQANLRLVVSVAKKYSRRGLPFLDVVQEGNLGLVRAVEKFDYVKGYKFSTYATWWIRQSISRGLAEQSRTVRLPVHVHEEVGKVSRTRRELLQRLDREPTLDEVAEGSGIDLDRVEELLRVSRDVLSLDSPVGDDGDTVIGDLVVDDQAFVVSDAVEVQQRNSDLLAAVSALPEREAIIVRMRFGLTDGRPRTLDEVGRHLGLTRERIRQLEKHAMAKLRHPSMSEQLLDWAS